MEDALILAMLQERPEEGLAALSDKYKRYCCSIAMGVLGDREEAEECANDVWLAVWRQIPPDEPRSLSAYCGKIARRRALDRARQRQSAKRGGGEWPLVFEELAEVAAGDDPGEALEARELGAAINRWLGSLPTERRRIFLGRYWQFLSLEQIGERYGMSESKVKSMLHRARKSLKKFLQEEELLDE